MEGVVDACAVDCAQPWWLPERGFGVGGEAVPVWAVVPLLRLVAVLGVAVGPEVLRRPPVIRLGSQGASD